MMLILGNTSSTVQKLSTKVACILPSLFRSNLSVPILYIAVCPFVPFLVSADLTAGQAIPQGDGGP